jgi:hypothetical protein
MTTVASHLNTEIGQDNLIYCSTFQLAWNELPRVMGGEITLIPESQDVLELNKHEFTREDLDEQCFIALADQVGNGVVERIRHDLKEKFNDTSKIDFSQLRSSDILAYAYLLKILQFHTPFDKIKNGISFGESQISGSSDQIRMRSPIGPQVEAFGIDKVRKDTQKSKRNQVKVLLYNDPNDFILSFRLKKDDYMMIAKVTPLATLKETVENTIARVGFPEFLNDGDVLKVPMISFDLEHHFKEMIGKTALINGIASNYYISDAIQHIKFELNEVGVLLRSEAALTMRKCAFSREPTPRQLVVDGPFLLYLSEGPSMPPYFAAWFNDTEFFKKI